MDISGEWEGTDCQNKLCYGIAGKKMRKGTPKTIWMDGILGLIGEIELTLWGWRDEKNRGKKITGQNFKWESEEIKTVYKLL